MAEPSAPTYCMLWADRVLPVDWIWWACMSKGEWSGWAQSLGAIVAMGLTIALWQTGRLEGHVMARRRLDYLVRTVLMCVERLGRLDDRSGLTGPRSALRVAINTSESLDAGYFGTAERDVLMMFASHAHHLLEIVERWEAHEEDPRYDEACREHVRDRAAYLRDVLRLIDRRTDAMNGWLAALDREVEQFKPHR